MVLTADEQALETRHLGFTISPHEECGVEEAVRLVEEHGGEVTVLTLGRSRGRGADPRLARERRRPRRPPRHGRRGVGPAGHRRGDRRRRQGGGGRGRRLRPDRVRQRIGRLGQLPGRHPRGVRARPADRDRTEGPVRGRRPRALRAGGARWPRHLRPAAPGRRERARGDQPAALPVGAGEAARALEAGRAAQPGASGRRGSRSCAWSCRRGRASRRRCSGRARTPRRRWSRSCATWAWPDGRPRPRRAGARSSRFRRCPWHASSASRCTRSPSTPTELGAYGVETCACREARPALLIRPGRVGSLPRPAHRPDPAHRRGRRGHEPRQRGARSPRRPPRSPLRRQLHCGRE